MRLCFGAHAHSRPAPPTLGHARPAAANASADLKPAQKVGGAASLPRYSSDDTAHIQVGQGLRHDAWQSPGHLYQRCRRHAA